jgi:hypothetical protein
MEAFEAREWFAAIALAEHHQLKVQQGDAVNRLAVVSLGMFPESLSRSGPRTCDG